MAISSAGQVSATFTLTDGSGIPLQPTSSSTEDPQQARVRLTIAQLESYEGGGDLANVFYRYVNNIDEVVPAYDSNGAFEPVDARTGTYRYRFGAMLPPGFDPSLTYTVGMQVDRTFAGVQESANPVFDWVPGGGEPFVWVDTTTAQCNSCHQPLRFHGNRREVRLCKLCHTEAAVGSEGQSIDFRHLIHNIHATEETGFPRQQQDCAACHSEGPTAPFYAEKPSTAACATCHADVNPSRQTTAAGPPGTNHPAGAYFDGQCNACHAAEQHAEFDVSVPGAHVIPERSAQLAGLNIEITAISSHAAGETPTISFRITNDAGTPLRDLSGLNRVGFAMSGPTTDYTTVLMPTAVGGGASGALVGPDGNGVFQYTPPSGIPASAFGTWAIGAEARREVALAPDKTVEEAARNPVVTFTVDDSEPLPHRVIADEMACASCHGEFSVDFSIHGNLRNAIEYCEICHNPTQSDAARRRRDPGAVAAGELNASIDLKVMIHAIHTGEDLTQQPYIIYGFGPPPQNYAQHDFGNVRYPGDRRLCATCHVDESHLLPPYPGTALPTLRTKLDPATGNVIPADPAEIQPITAVCTSCHDSESARAHAATNTAPDGTEACLVCHEEGAPYAVSVVHAVRD
ncbi:MAG: OmcA/MtrC family decaheme c-type cytochrome [Candidatus Binatia bacterium]